MTCSRWQGSYRRSCQQETEKGQAWDWGQALG